MCTFCLECIISLLWEKDEAHNFGLKPEEYMLTVLTVFCGNKFHREHMKTVRLQTSS